MVASWAELAPVPVAVAVAVAVVVAVVEIPNDTGCDTGCIGGYECEDDIAGASPGGTEDGAPCNKGDCIFACGGQNVEGKEEDVPIVASAAALV